MSEQLTNSKEKYGKLYNDNIKLYRNYFKEMCSLIGINVIIKTPRKDKHYSEHGEIKSSYENPTLVGCIFEEYPSQQTLKKLGWVSELSTEASIIHLPYDLPELQVGTLVIVPSGIDNAIGRVFRVTKMNNIMIYPASISCEIIPEWENTTRRAEVMDFTQADFNMLNEEEN